MRLFKQITTKTNETLPIERKINETLPIEKITNNALKMNIHQTKVKEDAWKDYRFSSEERRYLYDEVMKRKMNMNTSNITNTEFQSGDQHNTKRKLIQGQCLRHSKRLKNSNNSSNINSNESSNINSNKSSTLNLDEDKIIKMMGWVSATRTKNYLLDDQCVDWLKMYYAKYGITSDPLSEQEKTYNTELLKDASHIDILLEGGNVFERKVYEELEDIYGDDFIIVFTDNDMIQYREQRDIDGMIRKGNMRVKELMLQGVPIIAQAPMINDENMTYGVADILIRSDYLTSMFKTFIQDDDINIRAPFLNVDKRTGTGYHYRVIDCKWTTMILCVDGTTIRNEGYMPAYKGQLAVYTACLESLQGYTPNYAYIMSKAWRIDKSNIMESEKNAYQGFSAFDRPGVIDYGKRDNNYLGKTKAAIKWVQRVMIEGDNWRYHLDKPSIPELNPNMNKSFNPVYDKVKSILAIRYGDPTMVWYVGSDHRKIMNEKGIYSINNDKCNTETLGITSINRGRVIDKILDINRESQMDDAVRPLCIQNNMSNWQKQQGLDYYVDFETIYYNLFVNPYDMDIDSSFFDSDVSFMIGFGFRYDPLIDSNKLMSSLGIDKTQYNYVHKIDKVNNWEFICLYLVKFEIKNELEIVRLFTQFILARGEFYKVLYKSNQHTINDISSRLFHWTGAEIRFINRAINRIRSGSYTSIHMNNPTLTFDNENKKDVQKYLNNMINTFELNTMWVDMYKVFETEPIVVKGSYRFKLKHVGNAFHDKSLINTKWEDGKMADGFRAMLEAIKLYRDNPSITHENSTFNEIINYNEIDCKVIWEIVNYLRYNHCIKN